MIFFVEKDEKREEVSIFKCYKVKDRSIISVDNIPAFVTRSMGVLILSYRKFKLLGL